MIDRIKRLAKMQPEVFGADGHQWIWNPPLPEAKVAQFEREHGIRLPDEYRSFITTIANGGAGPFYGLFPLGEADEGPAARFIGVLSQPFPHTEAWNDLSERPDDELQESDEAEYERQLDEFDQRYFAPVDGAIPICHAGCAIRIWLVVTGSEAGNLWMNDRANDNGWLPMHVTFQQWYEDWLGKSVRREDAT